ncbi:hypothetical protein GWK15_01870 [Roseomonas oryzicola]|uniref:Uncharacterized protein n=1 Tax=Neoroseomonas oryzicola TaxID=535904 RepID=A0ABX1EG90_9PROT|nr:hypothetical protein [Neoroseomonas oryzicola]
MKIIGTLGLLILLLFPCNEASAQPRRTLLDAGASGKVEAVPQGRGEALRLVRGNRTLWEARDQRFAAFRNGAAIPLGNGGQAIGITGWTGGAYCCWTLHLFRRTPQGVAHVASLPLGKREPDVIRLAVPGGPAVQVADAAFDFWEAPASLATDLHPTVPFRWTGQALEPDVAAMRRPIAAALGTACIEMAAPADMPPPERRVATYPDTEAAIADLGGREWSRGPGATGPHPGVEAARLATCLIYSGQAAEARRLLRTVWPEGVPGLAETERQITARLACSPFVAAVRAANPNGAPYVGGRCTPNSPAQTALYALNWR